MTTNTRTCVTLTCDGKPNCDPWDDGIFHFDNEATALKWAAGNGWVTVGNKHICPECARDADCATTGHQHDDWEDSTAGGVPHRRRACDHCGQVEYDPPMRELSLLMHAAREMGARR